MLGTQDAEVEIIENDTTMQEQREASVEVHAVSSRSFVCVVAGIVIASAFCSGQRADDIQLGATFVCNGERIYVQNCNIRDLSDNASCLVAHPDRPQKNGLMAYTNETRGSLKKLLPTCKQPSAGEVRKANDFQRIQSQKLAANIKKANDELDEADAKVEAAINGGHPLSAEERQMYRCIAAGRDSELCTGKIFSSFLASSMNMLLPNAVHEADPGLSLAGHYEGKGGWLIDFDARYASTACWDLNESPLDYTVELKNNLAVVNIVSEPKHLLLTARPDGTLVGAGPFTLNGHIVEHGSGGGTYSSGTGHWETHTTTTTHEYTPLEASSSGVRSDPTLQQNGMYYTTTSSSTFSTYNPGTPTYTSPGVTYIPKTVNCPQPVLSSKQPAKDMTLGLRMRGTYEGINGLSIEFYPDSAIVGCGKVARAYPYIVRANGAQGGIKIEDPVHPLVLNFKADGELDPGQGQFEVHGRVIAGTNGKGGFNFSPVNATCNLELLAAANVPPPPAGRSSASDQPAVASAASTSMRASRAAVSTASGTGDSTVASNSVTSSAPARTVNGGNAILVINSGLNAQPGTPNPLANHPYVLLRESFATLMQKTGVPVPAGMSPYKVMGQRLRHSLTGLPENYGRSERRCCFSRARGRLG